MANVSIEKKEYFNEIEQNIKKGFYKCLGVGSGRIVFDLENGYVVKVAKNMRGIAQNEAEYKICSNDSSGIFAKIRNASEGFKYLIMDKAEKVKDISYVKNYYGVKNNYELFKKLNLFAVASEKGLILADLTRRANWGQIDDKPIIVDYGFTNSVRRKYYSLPAFRNIRR